MFEDRSKTGYNFKKLDSIARTKVETIDNDNLESNAHKKLFGKLDKPTQEEVKQNFKQEILSGKKDENIQLIKHTQKASSIDELPSSAYLKSFENKIAVEVEEVEEVKATADRQIKEEIDFNKIIESINDVNVENNIVEKELKSGAQKPKKNYSFRIKLLSGVYCIIVALFGGWIISNVININQTSSAITQVTSETAEVNNNILEILSKLKQLDSATGDPDDETITVKIITEELNITPEAIIQPNNYEKSSNWFDVLCNWISGLFGG